MSKNGNLLLNFPLPNSGELDPAKIELLEGITKWMEVNSEGYPGQVQWEQDNEALRVRIPGRKNC